MKAKTSLLLVFVLILGLITAQSILADQKLNLTINGEAIKLKCPLVKDKNIIMSPIDGVFKKLDANAKYDSKAGKITIDAKYMSVELKIGSKQALIYRKFDLTGLPQKVTLKVAPRLINKVAYVPLQFTVEALDAKYAYAAKTQTVVVTTNQAINPIERPAVYKVITPKELEANAQLKQWYDQNFKKAGIHYKKLGSTMYVIVAAGERPTGGYRMEIESATLVTKNNLYITAKVVPPGPDMIVTQAITYPHIVLKVEDANVTKVEGTVNTVNPPQAEQDIKYEIVNPQTVTDTDLLSWFNVNRNNTGIHYKKVGNYIYVLVAAGEKPTGGYSVKITSVVMTKPDEASVYATVEGPGPSDMVIQVITYPHVLIRFDGTNIKHVGGDIKGGSINKTTVDY